MRASGGVLELLTVPEVARILKVTERTVWRRLSQKVIRATRIDGSTRILRRELERYIDRNTTK